MDVIVVGCGHRFSAYESSFVSAGLRIAAICEPVASRRVAVARRYGLPEDRVLADHHALACLGECAFDSRAVLILTPDSLHLSCLESLVPLGYHVLCEKPLVTRPQDIDTLSELLRKKRGIFGCCHVLRYSPLNKAVREVLQSGRLGQLLGIDHCEPVGHAHFAHSYVRGNWARQADAAFVLLTKACHDVDLIHCFVVDAARGRGTARLTAGGDQPDVHCTRVASFGKLSHFTRRNKPLAAGDASACPDCPVQQSCPYSARRIYNTRDGFRSAAVDAAGEIESCYQRCVYECDNDVCDDQVCLMDYDSGVHVTLSMRSTTLGECVRRTRIYGSEGELSIEVPMPIDVTQLSPEAKSVAVLHDHVTGHSEVLSVAEVAGSHGGGDLGLLASFRMACTAAADHGVQEAETMYMGHHDEIVESHRLVFALEQARVARCIIEL
ncbi:hypothetical protein PYCC9005_001772 [Savitreella phatthalungensis]